MSGRDRLADEDEARSNDLRREPATQPHHAADPVGATSDGSFPASDPPSWSGSSSSPGGPDELPPQGEQAGWSIEREAGNPSGQGVHSGRLDQDREPEEQVPPSPEDALQS